MDVNIQKVQHDDNNHDMEAYLVEFEHTQNQNET